MKVKSIVLVLSILLLFGCIGYWPMDEARERHYEEHKEYYEEQREKEKELYEQQPERGTLVINNLTSSTLRVVIDFKDQVKIRPGRRKSRTVTAGHHILEAYDEDGHIIDRTRVYVHAYSRATWLING